MSRNFDVNTEKIIVADFDEASPKSPSLMSIVIWCRTTNTGVKQFAIQKGTSSGTFEWAVFVDSVSDNWRSATWQTNGTNHNSTLGTLGYTSGEWFAGIVTFDDLVNQKGVAFGETINDATFSGVLTNAGAGVTHGKRGTASTATPWLGELAYSALWSSLLSANHIIGLANGANPFALGLATLEYLLPFWGNEAPEEDWSGNGRTGTVTGSAQDASNPPVVPLQNHMCGGMG